MFVHGLCAIPTVSPSNQGRVLIEIYFPKEIFLVLILIQNVHTYIQQYVLCDSPTDSVTAFGGFVIFVSNNACYCKTVIK